MASLRERFARWILGGVGVGGLGSVDAVAVGRVDDGLTSLGRAGTGLDKTWSDLSTEISDSLEAWRTNPLARRMIGLISAYVVGDGIGLSSDYAALRKFLGDFAGHPQNRLELRHQVWCEELSRSGELFDTLHLNPADGMSYVRTVPAAVIDNITWAPGDYEAELTYHEVVPMGDVDYEKGGRVWFSPAGAPEGWEGALMLHFAVNRPVGCVRGENDLVTVLPWLRRYSRWLEDRVRLNAAIRAFLWVVKVPGRLVEAKRQQYQRPPEPGSIIVTELGAEEWDAVTPSLNAGDAERDGRAIRWMIVAGGPGLGLTDLGEAETANLATATAMGEQRLRFMRRRQAYFGYVLGLTALTAYNRAVLNRRVRGKECKLADVLVSLPDTSSSDNAGLGQAALSLSSAFTNLQGVGLQGSAFRRLALRLVLRICGESMAGDDFEELLAESDREVKAARRRAAAVPAAPVAK